MIKIVSLFLILILVLAMFGKLHLLYRRKPRGSVTCMHCGRPIIGKGPCDCRDRRQS
ncbi:MAG: hypothetical protein NXH83_06730 [Rhodobacteraceae bacterium]|nr:hypothetical protein [Paracoccaceae bacterium]